MKHFLFILFFEVTMMVLKSIQITLYLNLYYHRCLNLFISKSLITMKTVTLISIFVVKIIVIFIFIVGFTSNQAFVMAIIC